MKNQIQQGDALYLTAPSPNGFVSGNGYQVGSIFGVAGVTVPYAAGAVDNGVLWLVGCFTLPKLSAQLWAQGDAIYWDSGNSWCTNAATSNTMKIGVAMDIAANPSATGNVRLNGAF